MTRHSFFSDRDAALCASLLALGIALAGDASAAAGQLDPTFGSGGKQVVADNQATFLYPFRMAVQSDNKILVAGYGAGSFLLRLSAGGVPDATFGAGGTGRIATVDNANALAVQADGKILTGGGGNGFDIARYKTDGSLDSTFGGGLVRTTFATTPAGSTSVFDMLVQPDGKIVAVGYAGQVFGTKPYKAYIGIVRLNPDGTPDAGFGTGGKVLASYPSGYVYGTNVALQADGKLVVSGTNYSDTTDTAEHWIIARFNADGSPDASFGGGIVTMPLGSTIEFARTLLVQPDGKIVVGGSGGFGAGAALLRLNPNGTPDGTFGVNGVLSPVAGGGASNGYGLALQPDGKLLVSFTISAGMGVVRLFANGSVDVSYAAPAVISFGTDSNNYSALLQADGKLLLAGSFNNGTGKRDLGIARLLGEEITGTVVEFYNTNLKHYFVTATPAEQASIDAGGSGPGWMRTGLNFKSGGNSRVCRFYGTPGVGPNSHFYTVSADECGQVKRDPGWHFESYDFSGSPPTGPGTCPAGTVPVYRAYNGRFAFNDSNHRQTTNLAAYNATVALGWTGEGAVMCVPA